MKKEWLTEPDVKIFAYRDLVCAVIRSPEMLSLNGYVFLPLDHYLSKTSDDNLDLSVHGGLTYSGHPGGDPSCWALGFDCGHYGDIIPLVQKMHAATNVPLSMFDKGATYKNIAYVENEIKQLADQILEKHTSEEMKKSLAETIDTRLAKALLIRFHEEK